MHKAIGKCFMHDQSVLSKEVTQYVTNFTSFLKLLKEFHFLKGASVINFNPTI